MRCVMLKRKRSKSNDTTENPPWSIISHISLWSKWIWIQNTFASSFLKSISKWSLFSDEQTYNHWQLIGGKRLCHLNTFFDSSSIYKCMYVCERVFQYVYVRRFYLFHIGLIFTMPHAYFPSSFSIVFFFALLYLSSICLLSPLKIPLAWSSLSNSKLMDFMKVLLCLCRC